MPEPAPDALQALRDRLEETRLHAERLAQEAADVRRQAQAQHDARAGSGGPETAPPQPGPDAGPAPGAGAPPSDLQAIAVLLETLRELVPPELQQQLADVTRQVLLLIRALIDWWVERLAEPGAPAAGGATGATGAGPDPARVRNIPVR